MIVYKVKISLGLQIIELPEGAEILTVQVQREQPVIWFVCEPSNPKVERSFKVILTGQKFEGYKKYIGTFQLYGGDMIYHLFEC